jgi:transcriptional regulator with XRE-family HTH domain
MSMIGERIAAAREIYGWSQTRLAAELGVSRAGVSQWELGQTTPRPARLDRLAVIFNCSREWFEFGLGERPDRRDGPVTIDGGTIRHLMEVAYTVGLLAGVGRPDAAAEVAHLYRRVWPEHLRGLAP